MTKKDIPKEELQFIKDNEGSHLKFVCKRLKKIREMLTGISEGDICFCFKVERIIYSKEWFEWFNNLPDE